MSTIDEAREIALRFLDYAPRSRAEIERRLHRAEIEPEIIAAVVESLETAGFLNDAEFSHRWVEDRAARKGYGRTRLKNELYKKGIDSQEIEQALTSLPGESEFETALAVAEKRVSRSTDGDSAAERRRLAGFLGRRGYSWEIIQKVFEKLFANNIG